MIRAGVVLPSESGFAAIERVREGRMYHVLPGGGVEDGENPAEAAAREAYEELGVIVRVHGLVAVVHFGLSTQQYFLAEALGGEFGTGTGAEMVGEAGVGSYRAVWLAPSEFLPRDLRPRPVAVALGRAADPELVVRRWLGEPVVFDECRESSG